MTGRNQSDRDGGKIRGRVDVGIEDNDSLPPADQKIPDGLCTDIVNKIAGKSFGVVVTPKKKVAKNAV